MSREQDWKWLTSTCSTAIRQQHDIVMQSINLCNYLDDDYNSTYTRYTFLKSCSILLRIWSFEKLENNTYLLIITPTLVRFTPLSHENEIFKNFLVNNPEFDSRVIGPLRSYSVTNWICFLWFFKKFGCSIDY